MSLVRVWVPVAAVLLGVLACSPGSEEAKPDGNGADGKVEFPEVVQEAITDNDFVLDRTAEPDEGLFFPEVVPETGPETVVEVAPEVDTIEIVDLVDEEAPPLPPTDLGKPCTSALDCETDAGCLLGFCTSLCKSGGKPIAGACAAPSLASAWGTVFGCPADMNVCMPGAVEGLELTCRLDADCEAVGLSDFSCAGTFPYTEIEMAGRCLPSMLRKAPGGVCLESGAKCTSLICLHPNMDPAVNGICTAYCDADYACPTGSRCTMYPVSEDGDTVGYAPLCTPLKGSLKECAGNPGVCKLGKEYCGIVISPKNYEPQFLCLESTKVTGGWLGQPCSSDAPCFGSWCIFGDWANKVDAYCTQPCQSDDDCSLDTVCKTVHLAPYEGIYPYGPFAVGACLRESEGSPCFLAEEGMCKFEWSTCNPIAGLIGLGSCLDGQCPPACGGKGCKEDDGCGGTCLEACLANGQPCGKNGECLSDRCVDGVCCDSFCLGQCESCNQLGKTGSCTPFAAGVDPDKECGLCQSCNGKSACAPFGVGEDPADGCGACSVCGSQGSCVLVGNGADPLSECGKCEMCNGQGGCAPVPAGTDPKDSCAVTEPGSCLTTGVCGADGACELWPQGTMCGSPSCVGASLIPAPQCNGKGLCSNQQSASCAPYSCDVANPSCKTSCKETADCATGNWCVNKQCVLLPTCPQATKLICDAQVPGTTMNLANNWFNYGCIPGVQYNGPDRVYSVKFDNTTKITAYLQDAMFDGSLFLLKDACSTDQACVGGADLFPAGSVESLAFVAKGGTQYYLAVDGFAQNDQGSYKLKTECCTLKCAATNACGDDGCGGSCGKCTGTDVCYGGQCQSCSSDPGAEPNDFCELAAPLQAGVNDGLLLCPEGDIDWYSIELTKGQTLKLKLEFGTATANLDMALYGPGCNDLVTSSNLVGEPETIEHMALTPGIYNVLVYSPSLQAAGYKLTAQVVQPECVKDKDCGGIKVCGLYKCVTPPPPCVTVGEPVCNAFLAGQTSGKAANLTNYASCGSVPLAGPEDIYSLSFPTERVVTITMAGHPFIGGVAVLKKYCSAEWACVKYSIGQFAGQPVTLQFKAEPQTLYYLVIDGVGQLDSGTYSFDVACCQPECGGKQCGSDGCGMSCGDCPGDQFVCNNGLCECVPDCNGKQCGSDGCGGTCGTCPGAQDACIQGQCLCQPTCKDKECGDDGCGGDCGGCPGIQDLCVLNLCICQPWCAGKQCGDDGCGDSCGTCPGPQDECSAAGQCLCKPVCTGKECGDDGCGGSCGTCSGVQQGCLNNKCICVPDCDGKQCGPDGCGGSCGQCGPAESCQDFECLCSDDQGFEPNNLCAAATPVQAATYSGLAICGNGDDDWYSFKANAGQKVTATVLFTHAQGDLDLYLYKQGNCIGYLSSSSSSNDNEEIIYSVTATTTYFLRVQGYSPAVSNVYTLKLKVQ